MTPFGYVQIRDGDARFHRIFSPGNAVAAIVAGTVGTALTAARPWPAADRPQGRPERGLRPARRGPKAADRGDASRRGALGGPPACPLPRPAARRTQASGQTTSVSSSSGAVVCGSFR